MKKLLLLTALLPLAWVFAQNPAPNSGPGSKEPSKKTGEYRIVEDVNSASLTKRVNEAMTEGWEPTGGVCQYPGSGRFGQAMVKRDAVK